MFIKNAAFWKIIANTVILSGLMLLIAFPIPIVFALLLNEVREGKYKKVVQSITIIPRFLSVVVVVMIFTTLLSPSSGVVNQVIEALGGEAIYFMNDPKWFRLVYTFSEVWQFMGWNSIIYMAVLAGADKEQYEAAMMDGANRWKQTKYITMPVLLPTISINLIISVGNILNISFEKALLMKTDSNSVTSELLQTFVYAMGVEKSQYSFATAIGLFQSVIGLILLYIANKIINKKWETGLW